MKKLLLLLLFSLAAAAQTPVTVTGTIQDATGNLATSGSVQFQLKPSSSGVVYYVSGTTVIAPTSATCGINSSGQVKNNSLTGDCQVWGVDVITPANLTYTVCYKPGGVQTSCVAQQSIVGTSYNLNSPVFVNPVSIVPQYQTITTQPIAVNLLPQAAHAFTVGSAPLPYAAGYFDNLFIGGTSITWPPIYSDLRNYASISAAIARFGAAPAGGTVWIQQGNLSTTTTQTFSNLKGLSLQGAGAGSEGNPGTFLNWTGSSGGTVMQVAGPVRGSRFSDFGVNCGGASGAKIGFDFSGTASQTTDHNDFRNLTAWNCSPSTNDGIGFRVGYQASGNADFSANDISHFAVSYNVTHAKMAALVEQDNSQTVMNHYHDGTLTYTGFAYSPDYFMHFNAGDVNVDHISAQGPSNTGNYVVEPAALRASFYDINQEVGGQTSAAAPATPGPIFDFPTGARIWPNAIRSFRGKWEVNTPGSPWLHYNQTGTLSIMDSEIHSDASGNPGHADFNFTNTNGTSYPAYLLWLNNQMVPNNCTNFTVTLGTHYSALMDSTSCYDAISASHSLVLASDIAGYDHLEIAGPDPSLWFKNTGGGADSKWTRIWSDASNVYIQLCPDATRTSGCVSAIAISRSSTALNSVTIPTIITANILSSTANRSASGWLRLAKSDDIKFRNNANSADINGISLDASDRVVVGGANGIVTQGIPIPGPIGGTTPAAVTGTTLTANTQFTGPGTGLTGTAAGLSIGGNAATATTASNGTNPFTVGVGGNTVYRCLTAGALPVGALTIDAASCGTTSDTGLRVP